MTYSQVTDMPSCRR